MEPQWDRAAGYLCSVHQGWAEASQSPRVLTRSNLSPLSPPLPLYFKPSIPCTQWFSDICFFHITFRRLLFLSPFPPRTPPAGGIRDGHIRQGSESVLWGEAAGDVSRADLPWNTWTQVPKREGKGRRGHRRLWGGLHTAQTQTIKNRGESGPYQVRTNSKRNKRSEKLSSSWPTPLFEAANKKDKIRCTNCLVYLILAFEKLSAT